MTATDAAAGPAPASPRSARLSTARDSRWIALLAIALALVPLVVSAISMAVRVGTAYRPQADQAWIELQIRDIGHFPVLLGPYSRFGWFHPGPLLYYVLWLPYRLTGSTSVSLVVAALVVNAGRDHGHRADREAPGRTHPPAHHPAPARAVRAGVGRAVPARRVEPVDHRVAARPPRVPRVDGERGRRVGLADRGRRRHVPGADARELRPRLGHDLPRRPGRAGRHRTTARPGRARRAGAPTCGVESSLRACSWCSGCPCSSSSCSAIPATSGSCTTSSATTAASRATATRST